MRDVRVQRSGDGNEQLDVREPGEQERGLHGQVAAGGGARAGETGEIGARGPGGGEGGEGDVEPVPEGFEVGQDVGGGGFGEEAVGGGDEEGGGGEAEG